MKNNSQFPFPVSQSQQSYQKATKSFADFQPHILSSGDCHLTCIVLQVAFLRLKVRSILNKKLCLLDPVIRPSRTAVGAVNSFWSPCRAHAVDTADWESYFMSGLWLVAATESHVKEMWNPLACIPRISNSQTFTFEDATSWWSCWCPYHINLECVLL